MSTLAYLSDLRERGIVVALADSGDKLKVSAPTAAIDDTTRAELSTRKQEILAFLREAAAAQGQSLPPIARRGPDDPLSLSAAQDRVWKLHRLSPDAGTMNIPVSWEMTGPLDLDVLETALTRLSDRQEVLRCRFVEVIGGEPTIVLEPTGALPLQRLDATSREAALELTTGLAEQPFDLAEGAVRAAVVTITPDHWILVFVFHQIIFDWGAANPLVDDLSAIYQAILDGRTVASDELEVTYLEYAAWQKGWLEEGQLDAHESFWAEQLERPYRALPLPTSVDLDQDRKTKPQNFTLPVETVDQLKGLSQRAGATLYMTLLGAWQALLAGYGERDDAIVYSLLGLNRPALKKVIGLFANPLPIRTDLSGDPTAVQLVERVSRSALGAFSHQDLPLERVMEHFRAETDGATTGPFQSLLIFQHEPTHDLVLGPAEADLLTVGDHAPAFGLRLFIEDTLNGLRGWLEYDAAQYDEQTAQRLVDQYLSLLQLMVERPDDPISQSLPLTDADRAAASEAAESALPDYVAPLTETETLVADLWSEVLKVDKVSRHGNFFQLGGHSLNAGQIISRLHVATGRELNLSDFFESPTVTGIADIIDRPDQGSRDDLPGIPILPRGEPFPLSSAQARMWFFNELFPDSAAYHVYYSFEAAGPLNTELLAKSFDVLIERHEGLRTIFHLANEGPVQEIIEPFSVDRAVIDLGHLPEEDQRSAIEDLIHNDLGRPFSFDEAPPWRILVARLGPERHAILTALHHVIFDQWSAGILFSELLAIYGKLRDGDAVDLPALGPQYADFAVWQRDLLEQGALDKELDYWRHQLADLPTIQFPTDRPRPEVQSHEGSNVRRAIDAELVASIRKQCTELESTPFQFMLATFALLVQKYTGEDDLPFGVPVANRHRLAVENIIGTFVNTLVMRCRAEGDPTFAEFVERVRGTALDAYANQELPFELLVEELGTDRDLSRQPLFQMMFNIMNAPYDLDLLEGVELAPLVTDYGTAQVDLSFDVVFDDYETYEASVGVEYNTALFDRLTVEHLVDRFLDLLATVSADPGRSLSSYSMLTESELATPTPDTKPSDTEADLGFTNLVELHPGEPGVAPFFCVHDAGGQVRYAHAWTRFMDGVPLVGIQATGFDGADEPQLSIGEMAAAYVDEIDRYWPAGPIFVGGFSVGGTIAIEIGRQLCFRGRDARLVILIDTYHPDVEPRHIGLAERLDTWAQSPGALLRKSVGRRLTRPLAKLRRDQSHLASEQEGIPGDQRELDMFEHINAIRRRYRPHRYDLPVLLLRSTDESTFMNNVGPELGWEETLTKLTVEQIPGSHRTSLTEPHVKGLLAKLVDGLLRAGIKRDE